MKLKFLLLYRIYATYRGIQMTEMQKSLSKTSMLVVYPGRMPPYLPLQNHLSQLIPSERAGQMLERRERKCSAERPLKRERDTFLQRQSCPSRPLPPSVRPSVRPSGRPAPTRKMCNPLPPPTLCCRPSHAAEVMASLLAAKPGGPAANSFMK